MARIWVNGSDGGWQARPLNGHEVDLTEMLGGARGRCGVPARVVLVPGNDGDWIVLTSPGARLRVNGARVPTGIRRLVDRDELLLAGVGRCYLSTDEPARVEQLEAESARGCCPRCKQGLLSGQPAVRCPSCGVWYHQSEDLPCFTYAERCAVCGAPSGLDAGPGWTPEEV